jgi:hypothetical protein
LEATSPIGAFENHLFISYTYLDNVPLTPAHQGWVTRFHAALEAALSMRLGRKAKIWRDAKLTGTDVFADTIIAQFPRTALLVSIITPRYLESEWCTREVEEFCKAAEATAGVIVENTPRIVKILKTPVDSENALPELLQRTRSYQFFVIDSESATPLELDPAFGHEISQKYNVAVAKVAWHIAQALKKLDDARTTSEASGQVSSKPVIYLAECSFDRREQRDALETELRLHGYTVLPEGQLPRDEKAYLREVGSLLDRCSVSIHLIGRNYAAVPNGPSHKSVGILQNELAIERSKRGTLSRVIWVPQDASSRQPAQQQFVDALLKDPEAQFGADLVSADFETLKNAIYLALDRVTKPQTVPVQTLNGRNAKFVYLICEERDRKATIPLQKYLKSCGVEVETPLFEGDAATVREANIKYLSECDAAIVFYGAGDEYWKRTVDADLKKSRAYRNKNARLISFTYLTSPQSDAKADLIGLEEPNLIQAYGEFNEASLRPLLDALQLRLAS